MLLGCILIEVMKCKNKMVAQCDFMFDLEPNFVYGTNRKTTYGFPVRITESEIPLKAGYPLTSILFTHVHLRSKILMSIT